MFGGALRDHAYNTLVRKADDPEVRVTDLDIEIASCDIPAIKELYNGIGGILGDVLDKSGSDKSFRPGRDKVLEKLKNHPEFTNFDVIDSSEYAHLSDPVVTFDYDGHKVEIRMSRTRPSFSQEMQENAFDASVNAILMLPDGRVFASPDFLEHLKNGVYRYLQPYGVGHAWQRLQKMRQKYPHMRGLLQPEEPVPEQAKDFFIRVCDDEYPLFMHRQWKDIFEERRKEILRNHQWMDTPANPCDDDYNEKTRHIRQMKRFGLIPEDAPETREIKPGNDDFDNTLS